MRLKLQLNTPENSIIDFNYHYSLSAAIYKRLRFGSAEFSSFLHDIGFVLKGKNYKLFTFALKFRGKSVNGKYLNFVDNNIILYISSPLIDSFIKNFVSGSFTENSIIINSNGIETTFNITQIESLPQPTFTNNMKFKMLSPLIVSTKQDNGLPYYFKFNDDINEINRILNINLRNKYETINNKNANDKEIKIQWDEEYLKRIRRPEDVTRLISIKPKHKPECKYRANFLPFNISGDTSLIATGYECGFGEKNSMGFGMADTN
ncbi:MAG: CRISPR-associated endoribonuclease Cas6 [Ignavibacteriales bacterium]|nr:CRISPR-associated endoribonuclease Cas6 [Ignavibacteriales bacterium]